MLTYTQNKSLLTVTIKGKVTAEEVTAFYDQFTPALETATQVGLLIDISGFDDITAEAIRRDIPLELGLLDQMGKMPRVAIVTDKAFIGAALSAINPLVPMIDMRAFAPTDMDAARTFASDLPQTKPKGKGARLIESPIPGVLGFEVDGYFDDDQMEVIAKDINARIARGDTFNALARIKAFSGFDPSILVDGSFLKMKLGAGKAIKKYAMVSDEAWLKPLVGFSKAVTGIDMKLFALNEEQAAWDWLKG